MGALRVIQMDVLSNSIVVVSVNLEVLSTDLPGTNVR